MNGAFVVLAGIKLPWPDYGSGMQTQSTLVNGSRNSQGVFIGQRIGRDQSKIEMQWFTLDAQLWASVLQVFETNFANPVEYYDMAKGQVIIRNMYVNDRTARPGRINPQTGEWITAKDCKLNLIDTGG